MNLLLVIILSVNIWVTSCTFEIISARTYKYIYMLVYWHASSVFGTGKVLLEYFGFLTHKHAYLNVSFSSLLYLLSPYK